MPLAFHHGQFLEKEKITIERDNLGFERGFAVFDYCRVRKGFITFLNDHLERLMHSQSILNFKDPVKKDEIVNILSQLLTANNPADAYYKIVISGRLINDNIVPVVTVYEEELINYPEKFYKEGVKLILREFSKPWPEYKTTFYLASLREFNRMKENNAEDVLFYFDDAIRETARCNIFMVKGNAIYTPDKNILKGVTRKHVIVCARKNYFLIESDISVADLFSADEIFISSTTKNIMPVTKIEDRIIGDGSVGLITRELLELFNTYCMNYAAD